MSANVSQHIVYLSRTETFSASHRLHAPDLSGEENRKLFGKCNHENGHGHNYRVEVTIRGPVDPRTGMVINIADLKVHMQAAIMDPLDHKNIDKDVSYFHNRVSTAENIAIFIWERMCERLPAGLMYEVRLHETDKNVAVYRGEQQ